MGSRRPGQDDLTGELLALLGQEAFVALTENFGGRRLYMPRAAQVDHRVAQAIGIDAARRLWSRYCPAAIRIPLARELRALHYRRQGCSNGEIASKLSITETAVDKMFGRLKRQAPETPVVRAQVDPAQPLLFPDMIYRD
tara:strand:+ start:118 stop:537 length:420 start_codon:yes stop_codon:yes gene_type:complete